VLSGVEASAVACHPGLSANYKSWIPVLPFDPAQGSASTPLTSTPLGSTTLTAGSASITSFGLRIENRGQKRAAKNLRVIQKVARARKNFP